MTSRVRRTSVTEAYKNKTACVTIKGVILNPQTMRQSPLDFECMVDTGFFGGIFVPEWYKSNAESIGVVPSLANITLADGNRVPAYVCAAYLQEVDGCDFAPPGKPVVLVMRGTNSPELLGMDALKHCTIFLDGPKQSFTLTI